MLRELPEGTGLVTDRPANRLTPVPRNTNRSALSMDLNIFTTYFSLAPPAAARRDLERSHRKKIEQQVYLQTKVLRPHGEVESRF